jgi:hypothetical protein
VLLVDTNILVDVLEDDPDWVEWSLARLREQSAIHELAINPIIYAELSLTFETIEALDEVISELGLRFREIPRPALFLAGKAFCPVSPSRRHQDQCPAGFSDRSPCRGQPTAHPDS